MKRNDKEKIEDAFINGIVATHKLVDDARKNLEKAEHRLHGLEKAWKHLSRELNDDRNQRP